MLGQTIRTAIEALSARRMRSILTLLGILIGIGAVMLTVGLGQGASDAIASQINSLGSNLLIVTPGSSSSGGFRGASSTASLTEADVEMLADQAIVPDVVAVAPIASTSGSLRSSTTTWTSQTTGTLPDWTKVRAREVESGRFFTQGEVDSKSSVAVIGSDTATELYAGASPVGSTLIINGQTFTVIGVLKSEGSSLSGSEDDIVIIPITTLADRFTDGTITIDTIYLSAADSDVLASAQQEINKALLAAHRVDADNADFSVSTQASLVETATSVMGILTLVLGGIAAISLLVGGIGVMNIMLVSVSERVREIGLRKALGATPSLILQQFLVEAVILGLTGGLLGVALGFGGAALINPMLTEQSVSISISTSATLLALGVSMAIGLVAGVYPASRAARMAPIDALRSE
ncbi:MAG: ABC transporter permease [Propionibacteriaceae bacterium]|jgi:putative ABC transport system permease protein|nr:ABC transporter permease [Propionibacteriaceae bacterium]